MYKVNEQYNETMDKIREKAKKKIVSKNLFWNILGRSKLTEKYKEKKINLAIIFIHLEKAS